MCSSYFPWSSLQATNTVSPPENLLHGIHGGRTRKAEVREWETPLGKAREIRSRRVAKTNLAVCLHRRVVQLHINEANEAWNQKKQLGYAGLLPLGFYRSLSLTYTQHYSYIPNQLIHYECPFCFLFLDPQLPAQDALFSFQLITLLYSKAWFKMHLPIAYGGSVIHPQERNKDSLATQVIRKKKWKHKKLLWHLNA